MGFGNYREQYKELVGLAHRKGLHVRLVEDKATRDFVGMNYEAAKAFGYNIPDKTIYIDKNLDWGTKCHTLRHELVEIGFMEHGDRYWAAHKKALKREG